MTEKRKSLCRVAKPEKQRAKPRLKKAAHVPEFKIPPGAILANPLLQVPNNSWSPPPTFYVDVEFSCEDCGRKEIWTARQQKWYYEVARGSLYARAVRCRPCRRRLSAKNNGQGDPNPIKNLGTLVKWIQAKIEPPLFLVGFEPDPKNKTATQRGSMINGVVSMDYFRPGQILQIRLDSPNGRLTAETLDTTDVCRVVADVKFEDFGRLGGFSFAVYDCIDAFAVAIKAFAQMPSQSPS